MKKVTLATGIYRDTYGIEVQATVRGETRSTRFRPDETLEDMQKWQRDTREAMKQQLPRLEAAAPRAAAVRGTLETDVARYLAQIEGRPSFKADRSHLRAWLPLLGPRTRRSITTEHINLAIVQWRKAPTARAVRRITVTAYDRVRDTRTATIKTYERKTPATSGQTVAVRTIRHRCRVLKDLYHTLDGAKAPTPVDEAKVPSPTFSLPIDVDIHTIQTVAVNLANGDPLTYARYLVLVTTGQRPCQVMRTEPDDVNLKTAIWVVRSAKLEPAHTITLNREMVAAFRTFIAAKAWGAYDTSKHAKHVHAAGWPASIRPYNARHAVMIAALAAGVDLGDVQGLAGHTSPLTTRRFYGPLAIERQRQVSDQIEGRLKGVFGPNAARSQKASRARTAAATARAPQTSKGVSARLTVVAPTATARLRRAK